MEGSSRTNFFFQYAATFSGALVIFSVGMHLGWTSPSLPILMQNNSKIPITSAEGAWISSMQYGGVPFGCILSVMLVDRIGRKNSLLITSPLLFISWIAIAYAPYATVLMTARLIAGIAHGIGYTVVPLYVSEISNKNIRGLVGCIIDSACVFGMLVINITGICFSITVTALLASIVPIVHILTVFSLMTESPYYFILKGRDEKTITALKKLNGVSNVDAEVSNLIEMKMNECKRSGGLLDLFSNSSNRKALSISVGLIIVQTFSGSLTIVFYCLTIFSEGAGALKETTATIIYFSVQLLVSTIISVLVDRVGRRPLLITSAIGCGCSLVLEGIYIYLKNETHIDISGLSLIPVPALILYTISFNIGLSAIPILMMGELFPTNVKALCICITNSSLSVCIIIATKLFQIIKDEYGMHVPILAFAFCSLVGAVLITKFVPETKRKTLEQIHSDFEVSDDFKQHRINSK